MRQRLFRHRVLLLAMILVASVQLLTLLPMLRAVKSDAQARAQQTAAIGGAVFDEFMRGRTDQLRTSVDVLVADFGFKQAVASADTATVRSALANHSARIGADIALLLDLDGDVVSSTRGTPTEGELHDLLAGIRRERDSSAPIDAIIYIGNTPYQVLAVELRAPLPIAWAAMGFQVDSRLASRMKNLTGMEVSFVDRRRDSSSGLIGSTLPLIGQSTLADSLGALEIGSTEIGTIEVMGVEHLTVLRPFSSLSPDFSVALQLSVVDIMSRYRAVRTMLLLVSLLSLLVAVAGAYWLAHTVTEPVRRLVHATRRMREGDYSEPIEIPQSAELGELADSFNGMQRAIAEREERITFNAQHDSLTGLPNRELLLQQLQQHVEAGRSITAVSFALDRIGQIASSLGHEISDQVLTLVADILRRNLRTDQYLANVGGNEFVLAMLDSEIELAERWVEHLSHILHAGVTLSGASLSLRATAGIARFPEHSSTAVDLLRRAAVARTSASATRESVAVFVSGDEAQHRRQIQLIGDFPKALSKGQLRLFVQPKISVAQRAIVGAEALVRWEHPELGLLMPSAFVELIEDAGSIAHLTRWVIGEAVRRCRAWQDDGLRVPVSVNLSVHDLTNEYLPYNLLELVRSNGLEPDALILEVTESAIMHDVAGSLAVLSCIREMGFGISLDDFGTGQSSLTQLRRLPLDELKIDKSFVMNMTNRKDDVIVGATIELAHSLGLRAVAEGVESEALLDRLLDLGCEHAQGFHISAPIPVEAFISWAHRWERSEGVDNVVSLRNYPADRA
jgi:diguanylate cyclase (GGDEF)-like protein